MRTEDASFRLHRGRLRVEGTFITEVHLVARVGGAKRKAARASYWASELDDFNTGWRVINGTCGGHYFRVGLGGKRACEDLSIRMIWSSALFRVRGWTLRVTGAHVFDRVSGPTHSTLALRARPVGTRPRRVLSIPL